MRIIVDIIKTLQSDDWMGTYNKNMEIAKGKNKIQYNYIYRLYRYIKNTL